MLRPPPAIRPGCRRGAGSEGLLVWRLPFGEVLGGDREGRASPGSSSGAGPAGSRVGLGASRVSLVCGRVLGFMFSTPGARRKSGDRTVQDGTRAARADGTDRPRGASWGLLVASPSRGAGARFRDSSSCLFFSFSVFFFFFFRPALPSTAVGRGGWHDSSNINFKGKRLRKDLTPLLLFYSILVLLLVLKMVRGD